MSDVTKILDKKVGSLTLLDGALIGASKLGSEALLAKVPFIGNGTMKSGLMKVGSAVAVSMLTQNKKAFQIISTGVLIDGMEDLVLSAKRKFGGKMLNGGSEQERYVSAF